MSDHVPDKESVKSRPLPPTPFEIFETSDNLQTKVGAARELQQAAAINKDPAFQQKVAALKLDAFLEQAKMVTDLQLVSESAWRSIGGNTGLTGKAKELDMLDGARRLQSLAQSHNLDPKALEVAQQFANYLPEVTKFQKHHPPQSGVDMTHRLKDGNNIAQKGTTVTIEGPDGAILMRPAYSSDPRQVGIIAGAYEDLLTGKKMQDVGTSGREPKPLDDINGRPFVGSLMNGSKLTSDLSQHLMEKARDLPQPQIDRVNKWILTSSKQMDPKNEHWMPTVVSHDRPRRNAIIGRGRGHDDI